jgi:hypothetical protein
VCVCACLYLCVSVGVALVQYVACLYDTIRPLLKDRQNVLVI